MNIWLAREFGSTSNGLCLAGKSDEGLREIELATPLNPKFPPIYLHFYPRILVTLGRCEEVLKRSERVSLWAASTNTLALAAACHAALGRQSEAKNLIDQLLMFSPYFSLSVVPEASPYADGNDLSRYIENLRPAGFPE